jgi:hypothetical protein
MNSVRKYSSLANYCRTLTTYYWKSPFVIQNTRTEEKYSLATSSRFDVAFQIARQSCMEYDQHGIVRLHAAGQHKRTGARLLNKVVCYCIIKSVSKESIYIQYSFAAKLD